MNSSKLAILPIVGPPYDDSMQAPLSKIALLLLTGISCHYSLTPPHVAKAKTVVVRKTFFEKAILWITFCTKTMVWMMTLSDAAATYAMYHHAPASLVCPHRPASPFSGAPSPAPSALQTVSPLLLLGACAVILGNLLRQWCFRQLGPLFTFEITIQPDHKLVTTGPYAVVRHPSYIGVYMTLLGSSVVALARGAWLRECWAPSTLGIPSAGQLVVGLLVVFWAAKCSVACKSTFKRLATEDRELQKVFGQTWEDYAARVRWRILPGIY